ncbi:Proteolipid protein 2 [Yamadazyma tenuis]|uniref:Thioredoxin-like protein n=1 Tax=Candida tenuis (strain ATCC 10573 / BCRC 21748 / CBS 615 / JCM 9827 / NBRC 10315 / NRRL Y-1498 / VKM Y-70) TaxID=590646 RepID=G3AXT6_CANTC|nr:thioredoxin-like protein [Yamadazyma tenuis ATCC 10573]XP_006684709.1 uncharacterized protein CANTEDRAFT_112559 [Yamadazyma tenuis ATCC 10573]EGV66134.1 thioredoxin-like protein [Yamadazyma tenuis ATCC 10573]EGV66135.1 hypothetical protein CANTEDRAFT_112559 [Yamadazyma tenuis ATCC 10573]WEJ95993.1 Proteolipid protein 2 [Yamadazyma tenuis]
MNPMSDMKVPVEVDPNEDTEWNDILRAHGIIPEKPPSPTQELENALEEALKNQHENRLDNKELDELAELEDEEDEEFLNFYKQRRMNELSELQSRAKFGSVMSISKNEYEKEITLASEEGFVLVHLSSDSMIQSRLLAAIFTQLAARFPEIKFVDIPAKRAIENYPEQNIPTILIYRNKHVIKQYITLTELGGNDTKTGDIENVMLELKMVEFSDRRLVVNQDEDEDNKKSSSRLKFKGKSIQEDDSDDDFYD